MQGTSCRQQISTRARICMQRTAAAQAAAQAHPRHNVPACARLRRQSSCNQQGSVQISLHTEWLPNYRMVTVESRSLQGALIGHHRIDVSFKVGRPMAPVCLDGHPRHNAPACARFRSQSSYNREGSVRDCRRRSAASPHGGDQTTRSLADAVRRGGGTMLSQRFSGYEWAWTHVYGRNTTRSNSLKTCHLLYLHIQLSVSSCPS